MEEYNKDKDYPLGTIVNTEYGRAIVKKSGLSPCESCIFHIKNVCKYYQIKCTSLEREDKEDVYFEPIKEEDMEKRNIKIDINTARDWYYGGDKTLEKLALQAYTKEELEEPKLPKSWNEYVNDIRYDIEKDYSKNIINLKHLLTLRDVYRQGWKPNYKKFTETKYSIACDNDLIKIIEYYSGADIFSFPTRELAEQFLENFKDELEELKELL